MSVKLQIHDEAEQDVYPTKEQASTHMALMQEQQNAVKQLVIQFTFINKYVHQSRRF